MGNIIRAQCQCGFEREMYLGVGMLDFTTTCNFPFFCNKCRALFEVNLMDRNLSCPQCVAPDITPYDNETLCKEKGHEVFSWNLSEEIGRDLILTDGSYRCPKCGQFKMSFADIGNWD